MKKKDFENIHLFCGDSINFYETWETPTVIVSDGPYGVNGFPGDLLTNKGLDSWYEPHVKKWSELSTPLTTLWFWNTELGWVGLVSDDIAVIYGSIVAQFPNKLCFVTI